MRKTIKRIIASVLVIVMICAAVIVHFNAVSLFASEGYYYSIDTSIAASVYGRYVDDPEVVIPREFSDHFITAIAPSAFAEDVNAVTLNTSEAEFLETIGNYAFLNCSNLSGTLTFGSRMRALGLSAFQGCSSLEGALFYSGFVTVIPEQCFYQCSSLSEVLLPENLQRIDKLAFADCTSLTEITIPSSVTYIAPSAFNGVEGLTIYCYNESYAAQFAEENGFDYVILDPPVEPTEPPTEPETEPETIAPTEPAPTDAPTEPVTEATGYYLGDVNGDDVVNIIDATLIQRYLASLPYPENCIMIHGDVDGDGITTIIDVTYIRRYVAQFDMEYPIGEWVEQ